MSIKSDTSIYGIGGGLLALIDRLITLKILIFIF